MIWFRWMELNWVISFEYLWFRKSRKRDFEEMEISD